MNNDKLLRAFIEAQGFEIERIVDTKETPISKQSGLNRIGVAALSMICSGLATVSGCEYKRGDDECYYLKASMEVDYKVTKKKTESYRSLRLKNLQMSKALLLITDLDGSRIDEAVVIAKQGLVYANI